ncbi:MAG: hypothetical protein V4671_26930 [Armatimonadota bacterium]
MRDNGDEKDEVEIVYAIRYAPRAVQDIEKEHERLALLAGDSLADDWEIGLSRAVGTLARLPTIHAVIAEQKLFGKGRIHELLYQRSSTSAKYRVLFIVRKNELDAPFVRLLHIRHGARRPITQVEAAEIKAEDF